MQDHSFGKWPVINEWHNYENKHSTVFEVEPCSNGYMLRAPGFGEKGNYGCGCAFVCGLASLTLLEE